MHLPVIGADAARRAQVAELGKACTGDAEGVIERIAMSAVDDDLVTQPRRVGKPVHRCEVVAGHTGRRRKRQAGVCTRGNTARLCAGERCYQLGCTRLHLGDRHESARSRGHRRDNGRGEIGATEPARMARGVDDGSEAHRGEKLVIVVGLLLHGEALAGVGPTGRRDAV